MPATQIYIKTLTPVINPDKNTEQIFAIRKNAVCLIDTRKLDKILSLMCLLNDFNDFVITTGTKNITFWLKEHKLLTGEILKEISYSVIKGFAEKSTPFIHTFERGYQTTTGVMLGLIYQNIKNTGIFEYIKRNEKEINRYAGRILTFFERDAVLSKEEASFDFFINSLFATLKEEISRTILARNDFEIYPDKTQKFNSNFYLEKAVFGHQEFLCSAIEAACEFSFDIISENKNLLKNHLEFANYLNILKRKSEQESASGLIFLPHFQSPPKYNSNFGIDILNLNRILFLSLSSENRQRIISLVNGCNNIFLYRKSKQNLCSVNQIELKAA